jgi:NedA-like, galactose-binding domain
MCRRCIWLIVSVLVLALFAGLAQGQTVSVNFQQPASETPEGYLPDGGTVFEDHGNGWSYGWDRDISGDARDRGSANAPDQRWDTVIHLQKGADAIWEIALENGVYNVYIVAGDPGYTDQTNFFDVEGVIIEDPDGQAGNFDELTATVTVADGRLTLTTAEGASNAKICFIDIVLAIAPEAARSPSPEKEATDVSRDLTVGWEPGQDISAHDVYLGTTLDDVNNASRANPMDVLVSQGQTVTTFDTGRLEFGLTYYWRIDEVLAADGSIFKGELWSFTVEPFAYAVEGIVATTNLTSDAGLGIENTINGSGVNADDQHSTVSSDMWMGLSAGADPVWIQYEFGQAYKLDEMLVWNYNVQFEPVLGFGLKDVTIEYSADGVEWTALGDVVLAQATARADYAANTTVDFGGAAVKAVKITVNSNYGGLPQYGLSEVRFMYVPANARKPIPASEAVGVSVDSALTWRAGREAASHEVYLGTDAEALALAGSTDQASYSPGSLDLETTYYWKVDEVNEVEAISVWEGGVWSFTTQEFLVVDDFESYNDEDNVIYETWVDGWVNETGSTVGYLSAPFAEQTIVNSGGQSMPLSYDNAGVATAEAELDLGQNWTANGVKSLSLYFYGDPDNTGQLYVKIDNAKIPFDGDITTAAWQLFTIDLSTVGNVSNVNSLVIGIEGAGATGVVYIDDIRLYPEVQAD